MEKKKRPGQGFQYHEWCKTLSKTENPHAFLLRGWTGVISEAKRDYTPARVSRSQHLNNPIADNIHTPFQNLKQQENSSKIQFITGTYIQRL